MHKRRGELYSLQPIHDKQWPVESLTSYLTRLSEEHCCYTGHLIKHLIINYSFNDSLKQMMTRGGGAPFFARSFLINGIGEGAEKFKEILQIATNREDLTMTTLLPLRSVLTHWGLNNRLRRWCPSCLYEARSMIGSPYDQLLWTIDVVKVCPMHRIMLQDRCPSCFSQQYYLAHRARAGHCNKCGQSLSLQLKQSIDTDHDSWELFISQNVRDLLDALHKNASKIMLERAINFIRVLIREQCGGNISTFCANTGIPFTTVSSWVTHKHRPNLKGLSKIALHYQVTLREMFLFDENGSKEALLSNPILVPSSLRTNLPDKKIPFRKQVRLTPEVKEKIRIALEMIISLAWYKASLKEIAAFIGLHLLTIQKHFPHICSKIVCDRKNEQKQNAKFRRQALTNQTKSALITLVENGLEPTIRNLECYFQRRRFSKLLYPESHQVWQKFIREIE